MLPGQKAAAGLVCKGWAMLALLCGGQAWAWGADGHRTMAAIADQLIAGSHAGQEVKALLKPGETLESISTWMDCVKGGCGVQTPEMAAFVAANPGHSQYHYADLPFQAAAYRLGEAGTRDTDVVQVLRQALAVLQGRVSAQTQPPAFDRRQALLVAVHLVGDLHQPLHIGAAYLDRQGAYIRPATAAAVDRRSIFDTRGGNWLMLYGATLHGYWDVDAVKSAMAQAGARSDADFAARLLAAPAESASLVGDPYDRVVEWANESLRLAADAYLSITPGLRTKVSDASGASHNSWPISWSADYPAQASAVAAQRITRAGQRLALLLKAIWP